MHVQISHTRMFKAAKLVLLNDAVPSLRHTSGSSASMRAHLSIPAHVHACAGSFAQEAAADETRMRMFDGFWCAHVRLSASAAHE